MRACIFYVCAFLTAAAAAPLFSAMAEAQTLRERLEQRRSEQASSSDEAAPRALRREGVLSGRSAGRETPGLPEGTQVLRDIAYGTHARQKIDVFLPPDARNAPALFMVHGGAWMTGDKSNRGVVGQKAAFWMSQGYAVISVNYRMVPDGIDPYEQAMDVAAALAFVQQQAAVWGIDADKIVTMGHSAGAHLVGLLAVNPAMAASQGARKWRGTVMLDSGAIDVVSLMKLPHAKFYDKAFGKDEELWHKTSLTRQATAEALPLLIVCSSTRKDKPCAQAESLVRILTQKGRRAEVLPVALGHGAVSGDLGKATAYTQKVDSFIQSVMK